MLISGSNVTRPVVASVTFSYNVVKLVFALQVLVVKLKSTNVVVFCISMVEHVRIKLLDLPVAVHVDSQVDCLLVSFYALLSVFITFFSVTRLFCID